VVNFHFATIDTSCKPIGVALLKIDFLMNTFLVVSCVDAVIFKKKTLPLPGHFKGSSTAAQPAFLSLSPTLNAA